MNTNLVPGIKEVQKIVNQMEAEHQKALAPYLNSLKVMREINTTCETCEGKGWVLRARACAEDDRPDPNNSRDRNQCPDCHGTGIAPYAQQRTK